MKAAAALLVVILLALVVMLGLALVSANQTNQTLAETTRQQAQTTSELSRVVVLALAVSFMANVVSIGAIIWMAVQMRNLSPVPSPKGEGGNWVSGPNANWGRRNLSPGPSPYQREGGNLQPGYLIPTAQPGYMLSQATYPAPQPMYYPQQYVYPAYPQVYQQPGGYAANGQDDGNPFLIEG